MNKAYLAALIAVIALTSVGVTYSILNSKSENNLRLPALLGAGPADTFCPNPRYRPDAWMTNFITKLKAIKTDSDSLKFIAEQIPTDPHVFSTEQILSIFKEITFDNSRIQAIKILNPYILTLTSKNIVDILNSFIFASNKFDALTFIANTLSDVTDASKKTIIDAFVFNSDKDRVREILKSILPRNCIYGTITDKVVAFVIDISGSMDYTFKIDGQNVTRLQYVKAQLTKTLAEQLKPYQKFNIVIFSNSASKWKQEYVDATTENVNAAIDYINKLATTGATNISSGLESAYATKENLECIYLLSDGVPNNGVKTIPDFKKYLAEKNATRKVRINTVSFILGGIESKSERELSFQFLNLIADETKGSFKGITS